MGGGGVGVVGGGTPLQLYSSSGLKMSEKCSFLQRGQINVLSQT